MRRERGFTLLELSLAVALIGLLATLILPRLDVLSGAQLDNTTPVSYTHLTLPTICSV